MCDICDIMLYPLAMSQTSFSLYLHNQWTDFHKLSCTGKPQIRAICTYVGCTKATTNDWDIRPSVAVKALSATDGLISQSFVVAFVHPAYVQIALIWGFPAQLSLWKSVHWLWRYKLNEVCDKLSPKKKIRKLNYKRKEKRLEK